MQIRRAADRGRTDWGWLDSRHTFSFGEYRDPAQMGWRILRVINDDRVAGGGGFPTHSHRDMEILSYVLDGALEHRDSLGHGTVIRPGELQHMRAGTGVTHSEFNHSADVPVRFLQIWIRPGRPGLEPAYAQQTLDQAAARRGLLLLASRDGRGGSVALLQDADVWLSLLNAGDQRTLELREDRAVWVQVARGSLLVNGERLDEGDGAAIADETTVTLNGIGEAEVLLFELG